MDTQYLKAIIDLKALQEYTHFTTTPPPEVLAPYLERFWSVSWDLPSGHYFRQQIIPNPHVSLVHYQTEGHPTLETGTYIEGVVKKLFSIDLVGSGFIVGAKFHVGGFSAFTPQKMRTFTNNKLPAGDFLAGYPWADLGTGSPFHPKSPDAFLDTFSQALLTDTLVLPPKAVEARELVHHIRQTDHLLTVDQLASEWGGSVRSLQRLFDTYVGVGPKWIIRMFRLQEVKTQLEMGLDVPLASVAADLGYVDQAHMIHDFKSIIGRPPATFVKSASQPTQPPLE